jgi:AcrR family transcriptional regulator
MARQTDPTRRDAILDAARAVFREDGYTNARMSDIAKQAGVASGTLYLYFDSKEGLVQGLAERYFAGVADALLPDLQNNPDIVQACTHALHTTLAHASVNQDLVRLFRLDVGMGKEGMVRNPTSLQRIHTALADKLIAGMQQQFIYPYNAHVLAELLIGLVNHTIVACLLREDGNIDEYEETLRSFINHALFPQNS